MASLEFWTDSAGVQQNTKSENWFWLISYKGTWRSIQHETRTSMKLYISHLPQHAYRYSSVYKKQAAPIARNTKDFITKLANSKKNATH
jgi:hypothetical protein